MSGGQIELEVVVEESTKGGFLAGVLVGVAAGVLLAPRHGRLARRGASSDPEDAADEMWATPDAEPSDRSEALKAKIEETRRRLREQVGIPPE
jgi:gas vesicle protein